MMTALESPPSKGRLTGTQRHEFLKFPDVDDFVLGRYYQLSGSDLRFLDGIGDMPQKLGVAVLITVMRHVGRNAMTLTVPEVVLNEVALQLDLVFVWALKLGERVQIPKKKHGRLARSVFRVGISLLLELFRKPFLALQEGLQLLFPKLVGY